MNNNYGNHLHEKRIIASLVDLNDLDHSEREHLKDCPVCLAARNEMAARLERLPSEALRWTPAPGRKFALPAVEEQKAGAWSGRWYVVLATASVCLALIVMFAWPNFKNGTLLPYGKLDLAQETAADEIFIAETRAIIENSLPSSMQEMVPDPGQAEDNDDDYLDFYAPEDA